MIHETLAKVNETSNLIIIIVNIVLPIKDTVNKRTLNFYRKISKSHRSSVY